MIARTMRDASQFHARIGGVLYLLIIAAGLFAEFVRERFVVPGNAAAPAGDSTDHALVFPSCRHSSVSHRLRCG